MNSLRKVYEIIIIPFFLFFPYFPLAASPTDLATAQAYLEAGNLVAAEELLSREYSNPLLIHRDALRANLLLRKGLFPEAIALYRDLRERDDFSPTARLTLLHNYQKALLAARTFYQTQLQEAQEPYRRELLEDALEVNKAESAVIWQKALSLAQTNNLTQLPSFLTLQLLIYPLQLNPPPQELATLLAAISTLPPSTTKGRLLLDYARLSPSPALYEKATEVAIALGNDALRLAVLADYGKYLLEQGDLSLALPKISAAIALANDQQDYRELALLSHHLALLQQQSGNLSHARQAYQLAIASVGHLRQRLTGNPVNPLIITEIEPILNDYLIPNPFFIDCKQI
jgi:hypothetical protein